MKSFFIFLLLLSIPLFGFAGSAPEVNRTCEMHADYIAHLRWEKAQSVENIAAEFEAWIATDLKAVDDGEKAHNQTKAHDIKYVTMVRQMINSLAAGANREQWYEFAIKSCNDWMTLPST